MSPFRERRHLEQLMPVTCHQRWEDMSELRGTPEWRMCLRCSAPVLRIDDEDALQRAAASGACIHVPYQGFGLTGAAPRPDFLARTPAPPPPAHSLPGWFVWAVPCAVVLAMALAMIVINALLS